MGEFPELQPEETGETEQLQKDQTESTQVCVFIIFV